MSTLYVVQAQPNPRGRDTTRPGFATNEMLNEEWVEFEAIQGDRNLLGDTVAHLTFASTCAVTGEEDVVRFSGGTLAQGQRIRLHTGRGVTQWMGNVQHVYLNRSWYLWNNACGDRVTLRFQAQVLDTAAYAPRPPEGVLIRVPGTDRLEPAQRRASGW